MDSKGYVIADCRTHNLSETLEQHQDELDTAAFIVTACNAHEDLVKAIEPFAKLADWFISDLPDDTQTVYDTPDGHIITLGELRNLAAALALAKGTA